MVLNHKGNKDKYLQMETKHWVTVVLEMALSAYIFFFNLTIKPKKPGEIFADPFRIHIL